MKQQEHQLAIVIPAFKRKYLNETLYSLKNQTNRSFTLYIGDDNSPEDLREVIKDFTKDLNIVYKKFETNWGGTDLVSHWNRCIDLIENEEWIWLFSDDDCLEPNCVDLFYQFIFENPEKKLIHFNVKVIDHNTQEIPTYESLNNFKPNSSPTDFFKAKILGKIHSYVVEYVFHKSLIEKYGKFVNFDLAWCSDDATWINYAQATGISTISGAYVKWRLSGINISSQSSTGIILRKLESKLNYFIWVKQILKVYPVKKLKMLQWFFIELDEDKSLSLASKTAISYRFTKRLFGQSNAILFSLYIFLKNLKKNSTKYFVGL